MTKPSTNENSSHVTAASFAEGPRDLFARTLRTVAVLVGSCVLFVGVLSVSAVVITNKAMGSSSQEKAGADDASGSKSAAPKKPALSPARGDVGSHPI